MAQQVSQEDYVFTDTVRRNPGIDSERLLRELQLAQLHCAAEGQRFDPRHDLNMAMYWGATPQGHDVWSSLFRGEGFP